MANKSASKTFRHLTERGRQPCGIGYENKKEAATTGGAVRAEQNINTGNTALTYLAISTVESVDAVEYPDSNKFLVFSSKDGSPQNAILRHIGYKTDAVEYFAGEE